jgi:hypothetical protein
MRLEYSDTGLAYVQDCTFLEQRAYNETIMVRLCVVCPSTDMISEITHPVSKEFGLLDYININV